MKNLIKTLTIAVGVIALVGCASIPKIGQQRLVETSGARPAWVSETWIEQDNKIYVPGVVKGVSDYSVGLREAEAEGIANLAKAIQMKMRYEFGRSTKGQNLEAGDLGKIVESTIALTTENLKANGIKLDKIYWEKQEETVSMDRIRYVYDCYAYTSISKADYAAAVDRAMNGEIDKAKQARNKAAEELLNEVKAKLDK